MDITIIMPVYNVEKYIEKSINSVIKQKKNRLEYELIIINDGTQDNSIEIAKILLSNSDIKYEIIHQENSGVSVARNNGLMHAKGDYVLFLDSDDILDLNLLNILSNKMSIRNDIVFWKYCEIDYSGKLLSEYSELYKNGGNSYNDGIVVLKDILIKKRYLIWTGSAIYSRNFLNVNNIIFDSSYINGEDQAFIFSALLFAKKVCHITDTLSYYLIRKESISTSFKLRKFDSVIALEEVRNIMNESKKCDDELLNAINSYIIENFLYVYKSGLASNKSKEMIKIVTSLDHIYPNLLNRVKNGMKLYKSKYLIKNIEVRLAKKSLFLYGIVYRILRKRLEIC